MIHRYLAPVLWRGGVLSAVRDSRWRRDRLVVLCYHSLSGSDEHEWDGSLYMRPSMLAERFELLREEGYRVLPLPEAVKRLYEGTLPERSVALTFDDGTRDFATTVVPLLEKFSYPATVYLSTWYCGQPRPVFRVFAKYILWKGRNAYRGGPLGDLESGAEIATAEGRNRFVDGMRERVRRQGVSLERRDEMLAGIAAQLGVDYAKALAETNFHLMTPDVVSRIARSALVRVEMHTHRHQTPLDQALFTREIRENRDRIEAMTGIRPKHFCYPSGVFENEFLPWLRQLDVDSATTGEGALASRASEPLLLPRVVDTSFLTPARLAMWLSGVGHFLRRRSRIAGHADKPVTG